MSQNDYFWSGSYAGLARFTLGRAESVMAVFSAIEAGFNNLPGMLALQQDRVTYADDTGTANSILIALTVAPTAYTEGLRVSFKAASTVTGASVINVNGLGVKNLTRADGTPTQNGDIVAGQIVDGRYDGANFQLMNSSGMVAAASASVVLSLANANAAAASASSAAAQAATVGTLASSASDSAAAAATQANAAANSASAAASQVGLATTQANNAASSSTAAAGSATGAAASAVTATTQVGLAAAQVTLATTQVTAASVQATAAAGSATTATTQATAAAASATAAANSVASLTGTSTTSMAIGLGSKSLTVGIGLNFVVGEWITIASTVTPVNYLHGQVTSYNSSTGALVANVTDTGGTGTFIAWTISMSGTRGPSGLSGPGTTVDQYLVQWSGATGGALYGGIPAFYTSGGLYLGIGGTLTPSNSNTAIGIGANAAGTTNIHNTAIGYGAVVGNATSSGNSECVVIGYQATIAATGNGAQGCTVIGAMASNGGSGNVNTVIGCGATAGSACGNTVIGAQAHTGSSAGVTIGYNASTGGWGTTVGDGATSNNGAAIGSSAVSYGQSICVGLNANTQGYNSQQYSGVAVLNANGNTNYSLSDSALVFIPQTPNWPSLGNWQQASNQTSRIVLTANTSGAVAPIALYSNWNGQNPYYITVPNTFNTRGVFAVNGLVMGGQQGAAAAGVWEVKAAFTKALNGNLTMLGTATATLLFPASAPWVGAAVAISTGAAFTGSISGNTLTVTAISAGSITHNSVLSGSGIPAGVVVQYNGNGVGGIGTYNLNNYGGATIASEAMTTVDNNINIIVTGLASTSINWQARLDTSEMAW